MSTDGTPPTKACAGFSTLEEGMRRFVHRALEDKFKEPTTASVRYERQRDPYVPPMPPPPRATMPGSDEMDDAPSVLRKHEGHPAGLMEQIRTLGKDNGGRLSAALLCAGVALWLHAARLGMA
jgi:hypothetical protein